MQSYFDWPVHLVLNLLGRAPAITLDLGSLADWISGLGSLAAAVAAVMGLRIVSMQRSEDEKKRQVALAYELVGAIGEIADNVLRAYDFARQNAAEKEIKKGDTVVMKQLFLPAPAGHVGTGDIPLPPGSFQLLSEAGAHELSGTVRLLAAANKNVISLFDDYRKADAEMTSRLPPPVAVTGGVGHVEMDEEAFQRILPNIVRMDGLARGLQICSADALAKAVIVTQQLGPTLRAYLKQPFVDISIAPRDQQGAEPSAPE